MKYLAHSKGYTWVQNSWLTGIDTNVSAGGSGLLQGTESTWGTNWSNFKKYFSTSTPNGITANGSGVTLTNIAAVSSPQENGTTGKNYAGESAGSGTTITAADNDGMYTTANGSSTAGGVTLKKPGLSSCSVDAECASGKCRGTTPICISNTLLAGWHLDGSGVDFSGKNNSLIAHYTNGTNVLVDSGTIFSDTFTANSSGWSTPYVDSGHYMNYVGSSGKCPSGGCLQGYNYPSGNTAGVRNFTTTFSGGGRVLLDMDVYSDGPVTYANVTVDGVFVGTCGNSYSLTHCEFSPNLSAGTSHTISVYSVGYAIYLDNVYMRGAYVDNAKYGTNSANAAYYQYGSVISTNYTPTSAITLGNAWTVLAWVYGNMGSSGNCAKFLSDNSSNVAVAFSISGGTILPAVNNCSLTTGSGGFPINTWKFVAAVGSGSTTTFYDSTGAQIGSPIGTKVTGAMTAVGGDSSGYNQVGIFDELMVFNSALTPAEIAGLASGW